jgi:HEAT repeat protein
MALAEADAAAIKDRAAALLEAALDSTQPRLVVLAAETFLEADRLPPIEKLRALTASPDPRIRMTAVTLLGTLRRPDLVPLFSQRLQDADPVVRLAADFALASAGDPSQVLALRNALASPSAPMRRTACWLLGLMGNRSAIGLLKVKLNDPDAIVVLRAVEAIHRLGGPDGLEVVRDLTENPRNEVRYYATRLLGRVGGKEDIPRLETLCQSRYIDVKFAAIAALAQQGNLKRIDMLLDMLEAPNQADSPEGSPRALAARELGETAYTPAIGRLQKLMTSRDPLDQTTAAAAIVQILSARKSWRAGALAEKPAPEPSLDRPASPKGPAMPPVPGLTPLAPGQLPAAPGRAGGTLPPR